MTKTQRDKITPIIKALVDLYNECTEQDDKQCAKWAFDTLHWACRFLEHVAPRKVSKKAAAKARQQGVSADLHDCNWNQQATLMQDTGRKHYQWDHIYPVSQLKHALIDTGGKAETIAQHIAKMEIAWILKEEDKTLTKLGYRAKRPYPNLLDAYTEARIELT